MPDYKYGEKIEISGADLSIEICGVMSASQPLVINYTGEILYNVTINGKHIVLKENILKELISSGNILPIEDEKFKKETQEIKEEEIIKEIEKVEEIFKEKKKQGRPKKGAK